MAKSISGYPRSRQRHQTPPLQRLPKTRKLLPTAHERRQLHRQVPRERIQGLQRRELRPQIGMGHLEQSHRLGQIP